jgi:hypothetical protein
VCKWVSVSRKKLVQQHMKMWICERERARLIGLATYEWEGTLCEGEGSWSS